MVTWHAYFMMFFLIVIHHTSFGILRLFNITSISSQMSNDAQEPRETAQSLTFIQVEPVLRQKRTYKSAARSQVMKDFHRKQRVATSIEYRNSKRVGTGSSDVSVDQFGNQNVLPMPDSSPEVSEKPNYALPYLQNC